MNSKMVLNIVLVFALLSYTSNANSYTNDFCVANLGLPKNPSGYPCKSETIVTAKDFTSSGFVAGPIKPPFYVGVTPITVNELPGLNGFPIALARLDLAINGSVPMHSHPDATELAIIVEGVLTVGFVTSTKAYVKTVKAGDVFVFPMGLLHFLVNSGPGKAVVFSGFSSNNPSLYILDMALFSNDLATTTIQRTTLLEKAQILKLKAQFGGRG